MKKGEGEKLYSQYSTTNASCPSRNRLYIREKVQVRSKYLNSAFLKVRPKPFLLRTSSPVRKSCKRTASFTEGASFSINKTNCSLSTMKNSHELSYSRGKISQNKILPSKSKHRDSFFSKSDAQQCFSSVERIETISQHYIQLTQYTRKYGNLLFSTSEITAGPNSKNPIKKQAATVSKVVRRQFEPILRYQFSKLTRKDILPSLSHSLRQSVLEKMQQRMSVNLKASFLSISPSEHQGVRAN